MTVELFQVLTIVFLILGIVFAIVAVILFLTLGIRGVVSDLNGTTAKKAIRDIQNRSKDESRQEYVRSSTIAQPQNYTDRVMRSANTGNANPKDMREMAEALAATAKLKNTGELDSKQEYGNTATLYQPEPGNTASLYRPGQGNNDPLYRPEYGNTATLYQPEPGRPEIMKPSEYGATAILKQEDILPETTVLNPNMLGSTFGTVDFTIEIDLGFDDNTEIIE